MHYNLVKHFHIERLVYFMSILPLLLGTLSGICIATGIIFLFTGLRRPGRDRVHILFSLFAFSYAGANLTSVLEYKTTTLEAFMRMGDLTALFTVLTLILLLWFVSAYTKVAPRIFLIVLTLILGVVAVAAISRPTSVYEEIIGIVTTTLPWGETITQLDASESIWGILFFLSQLTLIGFLVFACIKQFLRGERRNAIILGLGLLFLILALAFDMLFIDSGAINFIYLGDFGFIPLLVIMSLQLSNQVIRTDEKLTSYQQNLEQMVEERTLKLEETASALRQSSRRARALLNAPPDSALLLDLEGTILDINETAAQRLGTNIEKARGTNAYDYLEASTAKFRRTKINELAVSKQPMRWEDESNGRTIDNNLYPIVDDMGNVSSIAVFGADITERKQLREREMEAATHEERNRLARDLHDAVTQTIYAASLIAESLPQIWKRSPEEGQRNLFKLRQLVRGALAEMRSLLFELRPASLERASIDTLIQFVADAFSGRTRVPVTMEVEGFGDQPAEVKTVIYRITQEIFNNIAKHAQATSVEVDLENGTQIISLNIRDNGTGFNPKENEDKGMGLSILKERAVEIGAQLKIESQVGQGTRVTLKWVDKNEDKDNE